MKIPASLTLDLDGIDIGESFKISSVKLDTEVVPTIQGRDFVIATLAAPTVMKGLKNQLKWKEQKVKKELKVLRLQLRRLMVKNQLLKEQKRR